MSKWATRWGLSTNQISPEKLTKPKLDFCFFCPTTFGILTFHNRVVKDPHTVGCYNLLNPHDWGFLGGSNIEQKSWPLKKTMRVAEPDRSCCSKKQPLFWSSRSKATHLFGCNKKIQQHHLPPQQKIASNNFHVIFRGLTVCVFVCVAPFLYPNP